MYQITREQYNYLLPVFGPSGLCGPGKLMTRIERNTEKYYFIGDHEDYTDALNRSKYMK